MARRAAGASAAAWRRAHRSWSCDLDSEVVGKVFDLHFFCRGNSILFHHLIIGPENRRPSSIYKGTGASVMSRKYNCLRKGFWHGRDYASRHCD